MVTKNNNVKFQCNSCTGCCYGGINLTLPEYLNLFHDTFPVMLSITAYDVRNIIEGDFPKGSFKKQKKFLSESFYITHKFKDNRMIAIFPELLTVVPSDLPCVNLKSDGKCSIYHRRPSVCSLYPVRIDKIQKEVGFGLKKERARAIEKKMHIPCQGFSENAPVFYDSELLDHSIYAELKNRAAESQELRNSFKSYFTKELILNEGLMDDIEYNSALNSPTGKRHFIPIAEFLVFHDLDKYGLVTDSMKTVLCNNMELLITFSEKYAITRGKSTELTKRMMYEALNHGEVIGKLK